MVELMSFSVAATTFGAFSGVVVMLSDDHDAAPAVWAMVRKAMERILVHFIVSPPDCLAERAG
jgi:hypothetical protein